MVATKLSTHPCSVDSCHVDLSRFDLPITFVLPPLDGMHYHPITSMALRVHRNLFGIREISVGLLNVALS